MIPSVLGLSFGYCVKNSLCPWELPLAFLSGTSFEQRLYLTIYPLSRHTTDTAMALTAQAWHSFKILSLISPQSLALRLIYQSLWTISWIAQGEGLARFQLSHSGIYYRLLIASYSYLKKTILGFDIVQTKHKKKGALPAQWKVVEEILFRTAQYYYRKQKMP